MTDSRGMTNSTGRYQSSIVAAEGWTVEHITSASRLHGANGIRTGADGRLYVAQVAGSQVSAIDVDSGAIETISPMGSGIVAPDDVAFDDHGNLFATELTKGRIGMRDARGQYRVVQDNMPCANPITIYQGRLIAGECRPGGRIMELDLNGGAPRIILDNVPMPNAFEVGPDGKLYIPLMGTNEIWRVDLEGGTPEVVATELGVPDAVKFDKDGYIVSTQVATGQVLRVNPSTGEKTVLATVAPGLDNLSFVGERLFVSSISGQITEILGQDQTRPLVSDGLQWPMGLALADDGSLFIADGGYTYIKTPGAEKQCAGMLFSPGFPGFTRGVVSSGSGSWTVTTANGDVARFQPASQHSEVLASGFDRLMGVALTSQGAAVFAELGRGRLLLLDGAEPTVLAEGLADPAGVAVDADGGNYVAEAAAGRVSVLRGGQRDTAVDGLAKPQGIAIRGGTLYIVDSELKELIAVSLADGQRQTLASGLPVGTPSGVEVEPLGGVGELAGPMISFTGLAVGEDRAVYIAADAEGSVLCLRPTSQ